MPQDIWLFNVAGYAGCSALKPVRRRLKAQDDDAPLFTLARTPMSSRQYPLGREVIKPLLGFLGFRFSDFIVDDGRELPPVLVNKPIVVLHLWALQVASYHPNLVHLVTVSPH